jgi:diguanylate cyclase (GGDEF)-like protein/PAS domain S-box-containing protein
MAKDTIVVVDDDLLVSQFIAGKLLPRLGYETLVANDGRSALELIKRNNIALMLLDLDLPDMSGLDLLRQLGREGRALPTIMITGEGSEKVAIDAFRLGVYDYLSKPLDTSELIEALNRGMTQTRLRREKEQLTLQLKDQVSWLMALARIGRSVTSTLETDEVLRRIVAAGVELTKAQEGFLALMEDASGQLYLRAVKNIDNQKIQTIHLPADDSLLSNVMHTGKSNRTYLSSDQPRLKVCTGYLVQSLLQVPVQVHGQVIGVLSVDNPAATRAFTEEDETRLISLANYAGVAIENARLYEQARLEISERRKMETALRESEERYALAVQGANDGVWDWDMRSGKVYYSDRWKAILGYAPDEIGDQLSEWTDRLHPEEQEKLKLDLSAHIKTNDGHFERECRVRHRDGNYIWVLSRGLVVRDRDGVAYRMAGSMTDITDRKNAEQQLLHDALHDSLTGLPNRALFLDRLRQAAARASRRPEQAYAVLFLDLDHFKNVNDSLGHNHGDDLLVSIARLLESGLRSTDTLARLGGDEFVILLEDIEDRQGAIRVADWIHEQLKQPIPVDGRHIFVTTSVGVVFSDLGYSQAEDGLRDADIAMYSAKANGRARTEVFEPSMRTRITERIEMENELRQALDHRQLILYYQPIVSLENNRLTGFEALLRWRHPRRGIIRPTDFLAIAEDSRLITPIDYWVLYEACSQMVDWQREFPTQPPLTISVNLSPRQVARPDLVDQIARALKETGLEPACLKLEITENAFLENNLYTLKVFSELSEMGVEVQIDDFGTGYSSLSYLSQFPVNALKIDHSFIHRMGVDTNQLKIVQAIISLTKRLDVVVIAEGVETEEQLAQLKALGCNYGQGYYLSKPLDRDSAGVLLQDVVTRGGKIENRVIVPQT